MIRIMLLIITIFFLFSCDKQKDPSKEEVASFDGGSITALELQKRLDLYLKDLLEQKVDEGKDADQKNIKIVTKKPEKTIAELLAAHPKIKENLAAIKYRLAMHIVMGKIMEKEKLKGPLATKDIKKLFDKYNVAIYIKQ